MANIAITNYCNLSCPYCFADEMCKEAIQTISIENLRIILDWIAKTSKNHIGLIGGEPCLHPKFKEILHEINVYCRDLDTGATLFTNGIELDKYIPDIGERIGILINVNSPKNMSVEKWNKLNETLEHLDVLSWFDHKANIGCNIYMECDDYSFIWEIIDKYKIHQLRTSVTAPNPKLNMGKEEYYNLMKPKFINFCKDAIEHRCKLNIDCNHIPTCYFTDDELSIVREAYGVDPEGNCEYERDFFCEPVIDITPDFRATACFGSYDPVSIKDFDDLIQLERYLLFKKSYPRYLNNCTGRCTTCKKHEDMKCSGGCLGFSCAR